MESSVEDLKRMYEGFVYRMTRGDDLVDVLWGARAMIEAHGSLEGGYLAMDGETHMERAAQWVETIRGGRVREEIKRGLVYFLTNPADGSTAKRLQLFFRWMGRGPDGIDLGCWESLDPSELIMPLDTHTSRICRYIGLLSRKTIDLRAAIEVSERLRVLDAEDPLRYDFPICHLGISGGCIHKRSEEHCPQCPLEPICTLASAS